MKILEVDISTIIVIYPEEGNHRIRSPSVFVLITFWPHTFQLNEHQPDFLDEQHDNDQITKDRESSIDEVGSRHPRVAEHVHVRTEDPADLSIYIICQFLFCYCSNRGSRRSVPARRLSRL